MKEFQEDSIQQRKQISMICLVLITLMENLQANERNWRVKINTIQCNQEYTRKTKIPYYLVDLGKKLFILQDS